MTPLQDKAQEILDEKNSKLLAGNIKNGVTIFNVTGEYEGEPINIVNSIVKQYKAKNSTIDANTFVEFINDTRLANNSYTDNSNFTASLIDNNKIMIVYSGTSYYLYGTVCVINDLDITIGEETLLVSKGLAGEYICMCTLETDKVFITYRDNNDQYTGGIVCNISNTTITPGEPTLINESKYSSGFRDVACLSSNKVVVTCRTYRNNAVEYLEAYICEINGTTITHGDYYTIYNSRIYNTKIVKINDNKFMVLAGSGNMTAVLCSVSGTVISKLNSLSISYTKYFPSAEGVLLSNDRVFVTAMNNDFNGLAAIVLDASGTTIGYGNIVRNIVSVTGNQYLKFSVCALDDTKILISYKSTDNDKLSGIICNVNDKVISVVGNETLITKEPNSGLRSIICKLASNKVFIVHTSDATKKINGVISEISGTNITVPALLKPTENTIDGLTKTECTTSTEGDVFVLN